MKTNTMSYKCKQFMMFAGVTTFIFIAVVIVPFIYGFYLTFTSWDGVSSQKPFVGIANYVASFSDVAYWQALGRTVIYSAIAVILVNVVAFILAFLVTSGVKGQNFFRAGFFIPNLIGGIVLGYIWQLMINAVLANFDVTITSDAKYGFWGLVILMNWQLIGYMMIIYIAAIQNIPGELIEAAKIDGATKTQTMFKVIIPMAMPSITICLFLSLTNAFKLFDQNLALTAGAPSRKTAGLALDIYTTFYNRNGWEGVGQAKAVVFFIIVGAVSMLQLYITRKREVEE